MAKTKMAKTPSQIPIFLRSAIETWFCRRGFDISSVFVNLSVSIPYRWCVYTHPSRKCSKQHYSILGYLFVQFDCCVFINVFYLSLSEYVFYLSLSEYFICIWCIQTRRGAGSNIAKPRLELKSHFEFEDSA